MVGPDTCLGLTFRAPLDLDNGSSCRGAYGNGVVVTHWYHADRWHHALAVDWDDCRNRIVTDGHATYDDALSALRKALVAKGHEVFGAQVTP